MKKLTALLWLLAATPALLFACPVCERQQPEITRGITHGAGPDSSWDYLIVILITLITLVTLFYSVKWLIRPGEKNQSHIKYSIFNDKSYE